MIFELMSNGTLAKLPQEFLPDGIEFEDEDDKNQGSLPLRNSERAVPFVLLLLPHNRYILGRASGNGNERWVLGKLGGAVKNIFLYDNEKLKLDGSLDSVSEISGAMELSAEIVTFLKRELMRQMEPPGDHEATVRIWQSLLRSNDYRYLFPESEYRQLFDESFNFYIMEEPDFMDMLNGDKVLIKIYWAIRFAMMRSESEIVPRIKAWLKAGPEIFDKSAAAESSDDPVEFGMKLWFSIMNLPDGASIKELDDLSFSREDLNHMAMQNVSPLLLFNPRSGYLILIKMDQQQNSPDDGNANAGFYAWAFVPTNFWSELRERRKMTVREIVMAMWGQHDIDQAMELLSHYAYSAKQMV